MCLINIQESYFFESGAEWSLQTAGDIVLTGRFCRQIDSSLVCAGPYNVTVMDEWEDHCLIEYKSTFV